MRCVVALMTAEQRHAEHPPIRAGGPDPSYQDWNLINRAIIPVVWNPDLSPFPSVPQAQSNANFELLIQYAFDLNASVLMMTEPPISPALVSPVRCRQWWKISSKSRP